MPKIFLIGHLLGKFIVLSFPRKRESSRLTAGSFFLFFAFLLNFNLTSIAQEEYLEGGIYGLSSGQEYSPISLPSRPEHKSLKVSLDFKGMDIVEAIKMISQRSGMSMVIGKNVTGKVTIFLKDVDIWDAFEIILASNNLAYEDRGGIIYVMSDRDYELVNGEKFGSKRRLLTRRLEFAKAAEMSKTLTQIKSNIGNVITEEATNTIVVVDTPEKIRQMDAVISYLDRPVATKIFELEYSQADKISAKLQDSLSKGMGSLKIDERTNKIAITDYPSKLEEISRIIEAFDEKPRQVRIDAQIVEISLEKDEFKMGVDWDAWINKNLRLANPLSAGTGSKLSLGLATSGLTLGEKYDKKGVLDMLRTIGKTKILSSPSIMALNNQEAKILVGTKEAYITSTTSQSASGPSETAQTVNFVDVGIKLYVTPTINKDGFVTIKIKPEVSSSKTTSLTSEGKTTDVPIVTTSEAETTVILKDGSTLVIAGLKKDKKENEIKKIPGLGDIPFLGAAFRSVSSTLNKSELVIFLTPHIVSEEKQPEYNSLTRDKDILRLSQESRDSFLSNRLAIDQSAANLTPEDYYQHIRAKISSLVDIMNSQAHFKGKTMVSFTINPDGNLSGEPQIISSTSSELNEPTVNIIKSASPFPNFPQALNKPAQQFDLAIRYE